MSYTVEELCAPSFNVSDKAITATRRLRLVDWSDVDDFIADLYPSGIPTGGEPYRPGQAVFPGMPHLVLKEVRVEPFDENNISGMSSVGTAMCGSGAAITLEYGTLDYDTGGGGGGGGGGGNPDDPTTWLSHDIESHQEYLTCAHSALRWSSAGVVPPPTNPDLVEPDMNPGVPITIINHSLTWHRVPDPPWQYWNGFVGKVNDVKFLGHQYEQVLFAGYGATRTMKTDGTSDYEVKMSFVARIVHGETTDGGQSVGWNHFLRPSGKWTRLLHNTTGKPLLTLANMDAIFQYPAPDS